MLRSHGAPPPWLEQNKKSQVEASTCWTCVLQSCLLLHILFFSYWCFLSVQVKKKGQVKKKKRENDRKLWLGRSIGPLASWDLRDEISAFYGHSQNRFKNGWMPRGLSIWMVAPSLLRVSFLCFHFLLLPLLLLDYCWSICANIRNEFDCEIPSIPQRWIIH